MLSSIYGIKILPKKEEYPDQIISYLPMNMSENEREGREVKSVQGLKSNSHIYYIQNIEMGSASGSAYSEPFAEVDRLKKQSPVGLLAFTILDYEFAHESNIVFFNQKCTRVKIALGHQEQIAELHKCGEQEDEAPELCSFVINSSYQSQRTLRIHAYDDRFLIGTGELGVGLFNVDEIISEAKSQISYCQICLQSDHKLTLKFRVTFIPQSYQTLSFMFTSVMGGYSLSQGVRKLFLRVQIGEEVLDTKPKYQTKSCLPEWVDNILRFRVINPDKTGKITLFEVIEEISIEIVSFSFCLSEMAGTYQQLSFTEIIPLKNQNGIVYVQFQTLKGRRRTFDLPAAYKIKNKQKMINIQCPEEINTMDNLRNYEHQTTLN